MEDVGVIERICDKRPFYVEEDDVLTCLVNLAASSPPQEPSLSEQDEHEEEDDLEDEDYKSEGEPAANIREVLAKLVEHHCAWPFRNPVDASSVYTASYYSIIKNPMDFTVMQVWRSDATSVIFLEEDEPRSL